MSKVNVDNPYVTQIDKFANSLRHLSNTFLHLEEKRDTLTQTEMEEIFTEVDESVCKDCENREWCMGENSIPLIKWYMKFFLRWKSTVLN